MAVKTVPLLPFNFRAGESRDTVSIPADKLNALYREKYLDDYGFWQSLYGLFGTMRMNSLQKFEVTKLKGFAGLWRELKGCTMQETGALSTSVESVTPIPMYNLNTFCPTDEIDGMFKQLHQWDTNGRGGLSADGARALNIYLKEYLSTMTESLRNTLCLNGLHDFTVADFVTETNAAFKLQLENPDNSLSGWLKLLDATYTSDTTANYNLNYNKGTFVVAGDFTNGEYTGATNGPVVGLYDELKGAAPKPLQKLMHSGGKMTVKGRMFQAVFAMSDGYYSKFITEYHAEISALASNGMRITKEPRTAAGFTKDVYFIDGVPVVPVSQVTGLDEYIAADTHFIGIVATQNIQLGTSFSALPTDIESTPIALQVFRSTDLTSMAATAEGLKQWEQGRIKQLSHAVGATALSNKDYIISNITITA